MRSILQPALRRSGIGSALVALAVLAACTTRASPEAMRCLRPDQHEMVVAELFFGRAVAGRALVSDAEWQRFAAEVVAPAFPDGFTAWDAEGAWRDPATGVTSYEPSKILLIAAAPAPDLGDRLQRVIDAYRARFQQKSVGLITRTECAGF